MKSAVNKFLGLTGLWAALLLASACDDNGNKVKEPVADFTFVVKNLSVEFLNASTNGVTYAWDFGDGGTSTEASPTYTYKTAGDYNVKLTVTGESGSTPAVKTQKVTATAPPIVNLIKGGSFEAADATAWTLLYSGQKDSKGAFQHAKYEFGNTKYKINGATNGALYIYPDNDAVTDSEEGTILYQKVDNLKAGNYQVSALMRCAGENKDNPTAAMNQYWFEIVVHQAAPQDGNGYDNGRATGWYYGGWTGWKLVVPVINGPMPHGSIADSLADKDGKFTLSKDGTYYVVIKFGKGNDKSGASFGDGIALDNLVISKID